MDGSAFDAPVLDSSVLGGLPALTTFLDRQARVGTLRFLTCGSVDDGKSTLIGRLLHDTRMVFDDQLATLARDTARHGTTGEAMDFALLVDGLEAERAQGITIDVAYRYFTTERRRFMVADTPGHEQYTRNMATGASNAELAVVLVDARQGVLIQTRRHSFIAALMGIRHIVLAVNKIDLVDFSADRFAEIARAYAEGVRPLGFTDIVAIPICARDGDNVTARGDRMPWYGGPTLLEHLESVDTAPPAAVLPPRMPVQWVNRPDAGFRGYAGTIASGTLRAGEAITIAPSGRAARVARIVTMDGDRASAAAGEAVTIVLDGEHDVSRGDVIAAGRPVPVAASFDARLIWLHAGEMFVGRNYLVKLGGHTVSASVTRLHHHINPHSFAPVAGETLAMNEIALVRMALASPVPMEPFAACRELGRFIVIDRISNATVGVGMIETVGSVATDVTWHAMTVDKHARAALKGQRPAAIWFTGLSGSGKSTIANALEQRLHARGRHTMLLDGDNVRHGLNRDLGFTEADRVENIRRAAEAARLMTDAGLIVLVSFISPYRGDRDSARERFEPGEFLEVFVDTPIEECRRRDPKGLYKRADAGQIRNFTGVDAPYEPPTAPEVHLRTLDDTADMLVDRLIATLLERGLIT